MYTHTYMCMYIHMYTYIFVKTYFFVVNVVVTRKVGKGWRSEWLRQWHHTLLHTHTILQAHYRQDAWDRYKRYANIRAKQDRFGAKTWHLAAEMLQLAGPEHATHPIPPASPVGDAKCPALLVPARIRMSHPHVTCTPYPSHPHLTCTTCISTYPYARHGMSVEASELRHVSWGKWVEACVLRYASWGK